MNLSLFSKLLVFCLAIVCCISACKSDEVIIDPIVNLPKVELDSSGVHEQGMYLAHMNSFVVNLKATAGMDTTGWQLDEIIVREDYRLLDANRISLGSNPANIPESGEEVLDTTITIFFKTFQDGVVIPADYTYTFEVKARNGLIGETFLQVTTIPHVPPTLTPISDTVQLVAPNSYVPLDFEIRRGSDILNNLTIYEDGNLMTEIARLHILDPTEGWSFDPGFIFMEEGYSNSFEDIFYIKLNNGFEESFEYKFVVEDVNEEKDSFTFTVNTWTEAESVPVALTNNAKLVNRDSVGNFGGLDLDNSAGVDSTDITADLLDLGRDTSTGIWQQNIMSVDTNNIVLREFDRNVSPIYNFDFIDYKQQIVLAYEQARKVDRATVSEGDVFLIRRKTDEQYFMIKCVELNNENEDPEGRFYRFEIKQ